MFVGAIRGQMSAEQQEKWLPLAQKHTILGTYAQTEMGHGSNVRGLETTATFDAGTISLTRSSHFPSFSFHFSSHLGENAG